MSLADRIPSSLKPVSTARMILILWFAGAAFLGALFVLVALQRLGLTANIAHPISAAFFVVCLLVASWAGRTVNAPLFFFAERSGNSAALGVGGASVWVGGAFILLFFGLSGAERMTLGISALLAIALYGLIFAGPMRASMVASLPGVLAWRHQAREAALAVLPVCLVVMALMAVAEQAIATQFLALLSGVDEKKAAWIVAALAIMPALLGGWLALMIVNAVLGVWILIALLGPATVIGFATDWFAHVGDAAELGQLLPLLIPPESELLAGSDAMFLPIALIVLATGLASLPQSLARAALAKRRVAAIENAAWSALTIFLIFSAISLSIGLIIQTPDPSVQAGFLRQQIALNILPYAAILFAAFNGLSISIWVLVSTLVRTLRRGRVVEPGGGSMFTIRVLLVASTLPLAAWPDLTTMDTSGLLLSAIALSSAGLFVPMTATFWIARAGRFPTIASALTGGGVTGVLLLLDAVQMEVGAGVSSQITAPVMAGAIGLCLSAAVMIGCILLRPSAKEAREAALIKLGSPDDA